MKTKLKSIMYKKIILFLLVTFVWVEAGLAYWQIEYDEYIRDIMAKYAGQYLPKRVGQFRDLDECQAALQQAVAESGDPSLANHMSCVGYDETSSVFEQGGYNTPSYTQDDYKSQAQIQRERELEYRKRVSVFRNTIKEVIKQYRKDQSNFNQDKEALLSQLKEGSRLKLKGEDNRLAFKTGKSPGYSSKNTCSIQNLKDSAWWAIKAADAAIAGNYESARESGQYSFEGYHGGSIDYPSVPEVPYPEKEYPEVKVYRIIIGKVNKINKEVQKINLKIKQVEKEKTELKEKIELQENKVKEFRKAKEESKKKDDSLLDEAYASLEEAKQLYKKASEKLDTLNSEKDNYRKQFYVLKRSFDEVNNHPEEAPRILKQIERKKDEKVN